MEDSSEEEQDSNDATKEICARCRSTDQIQTNQLKKLRTNVSSQPNKRSRRNQGHKFDVFLGHSGKQKNFVRQLYRDLTNQGLSLSCFFDEDRDESLPVGAVFPPRIFEAVETCGVAIFLLSKEFLESKWPMLELDACVKAQGTNSPPVILPLFFIISPAYLKQTAALNEKWKEIGIEEQQCVGWHKALKTIRSINGLNFSEGGNEVQFRDEIVPEIWRKLPAASPRYHVPFMQGELRMCQEVEDFLKNKVHPNNKGIRIAGLHGIAGQGKTTVAKAFCNLKLKDFEGNVCYLDFSEGDSFERAKLALHHLIHCPQSHRENLIKDQAQVKLYGRVKGQRVLLVLDNITEDDIEEVRYFTKADFGESSCILLSARSSDVLVKHCKIDLRSCMRVPSLKDDDAIALLLDSTSPEQLPLGAVDKAFALKCANRCSFKEPSFDSGTRGRRFHPLALKAFGSHLFAKYGSNLSKWAAEIDGLADRSFYGLHDVFNLLDRAFDDLAPKYRTIFMLLTVYLPPNMSRRNVMEWLAVSCNENIEFIEKAVEDLCKKAFIEESEPEIRIHDLCFEFAQSKANEMGRWLCCKADEPRGLISQESAGFELAKLEGCMRRSPSEIAPKFLEKLLVLQLINVQNVNSLDLGRMDSLRSITLHDCKVMSALDGMENLLNLAWLQIRGLGKALELPKLSSLIGLQHLEIDITVGQRVNQLGDLTPCFRLKEINVRCAYLLEFPKLKGLRHLAKVKFSACSEVKGPLDCTECVELQSVVLVDCCKMVAPPRLVGCKKISEIVLCDCGAMRAFMDIDLPSAPKTLQLQISSDTWLAPKSLECCYRLENLRLLDMGGLEELPSFRRLSNLTVLEIGKCGIFEPPDLTCCVMLEDVHFYTLKYLVRFPNFSLLRKLKKLNLCNCIRVLDPPDISGCHQLQLLYLQHNDNMRRLPKMDECTQLEEIKVSWQCKDDDEVRYEGDNSYNVNNDLEACLDCFKDVILENLNDVSVPEELRQWMKDKTMLAKKYFRGVKLFYSVTAPYESDICSKRYKSRNPVTLKSVEGKVFCSTQDNVNEDYAWLSRMREYFAGRDIAGPSAASGKKVNNSSPASLLGYRVEMWKTTIPKAFSDFRLRNFDRKVWQLKFCGAVFVKEKLALHYLTQFRNLKLEWATTGDEAHYFLKRGMKGEKVLLVVDNITENNINEMRCYVGEELGEISLILWTARSVDALDMNSNVTLQSFRRLQEEEVIAILIETGCGRHKCFALKCANTCSFEKDRGSASKIHKFALKAFGRDSPDLSYWITRINSYAVNHLDAVFAALDRAVEVFDRSPRLRACFYHFEKWIAEIDSLDNVFAGLCWLAIKCVKEFEYSEEKEIKLVKLKKEIKYIKTKLPSNRDIKGQTKNCEGAIKKEIEKVKQRSRDHMDIMIVLQFKDKKFQSEKVEQSCRDHIGIRILLQIIDENYIEVDASSDHPRLKDALEDGLGNHLDNVFRTLKNGYQDLDRFPRLQKHSITLGKWFDTGIKGIYDVLTGLCWLAIKWEKEFEHLSKKDGIKNDIAKEFTKEIEDIKAIMSSDEVVKWVLINCHKDIDEKVGDIKHIIHKKFLPIKKTQEKEERREILQAISHLLPVSPRCSHLLPVSPRCHVPSIQGETRMCQEVADVFNNVRFNEKGIRIVGLYGISGLGKTTIAKAFYNLSLRDIACDTFLLQFCGDNVLDRQKLALCQLTQFPTAQLESLKSIDDAQSCFNIFLKGQRVVLVMDNITEDNVDEVKHYLSAEWGKSSGILLIAQSIDILRNLNIESGSCMRVPRLEKEEAMTILLERTQIKISALGQEHRDYALECAKRCSFKENRYSAPAFHPLALKAFGRYLFNKHRSDLSKWFAELDGLANEGTDGLDGILAVFEKAFNDMDPIYRTIFMVLARHMPHNASADNVIKWAALNCHKEIMYIKKAVKDLCENAFIEEIEHELHINDFIKEIVQVKKKKDDKAGEAKFRGEIVRTICCLLPQSYHIPAMQGEARMCQEVVDFFNTDGHANEKGIRIAGLYGMPGLGKTTLVKAFCNLNFRNFNGKVYHLEFASQGPSMEREKFKLLSKSLQDQRVLLVLDNIQTEESIDDVNDFLQGDWGENSWVLLSSRCYDFLKDFIGQKSCMSVPTLEEEEAIAILLERTSLADSALAAEDKGFALKCANKCLFSFSHTFHPLALKTLGRHLFSKYGSHLSKWVPELDGLVVGSDDGMDDMFTVLISKVFDNLDSKYQTIFMLLTVYLPADLPPSKVAEWLAINCKEEIDFVEKTVEDLWQRAFIEEIEPEIRIHDLFVEFAQSKARKRKKWLWCNGDHEIPSEAKEGLMLNEDEEGFELAKLEHWHHQDLSGIGDSKYLCALQVSRSDMNNLKLSSMKNIKSLTLNNCQCLEVLQGMENLQCLAWLQIVSLPKLRVLNLSSLTALQYLEVNTGGPTELGDLTGCVFLTEIYVRCPSLWEFPILNGLPKLKKATFKACGEVIGQLDCRECIKLQSIVLENCWQMAHIPLIDGCNRISKIVLNRCDQVLEYTDDAVEIVKLCISSDDVVGASRQSECCGGMKHVPMIWNIVVSKDVIPTLRRFSNLTVLKLHNCDITEPPDVACCEMLEYVCFSTLKNLESFPDFSSLWRLEKLCLCNCQRVGAPPDIGRCYKLKVFHLLFNDNMKGLPRMDRCKALKEIKLSWQSKELFNNSHCYEYDDIEFCSAYQQDEIFRKIDDVVMPAELKVLEWIQNKAVRVQRYFCREKVYYFIMAPSELYRGSGRQEQANNADSLEKVIIQRASAISVRDEDEKRFIENVIRAIDRFIPPRIRFPYSSMQKEITQIWLKKATTIKGIHMAGLYETKYNEKTVLHQSFYNFKLKGFEGGVSPLEFTKGSSMERLSNAIQYLTETASPTSEITDEDAFSKGLLFNIMILLIKLPITDKFMENNVVDIARDFHRNWNGSTRIIVRSERYTIIEFSRP